MSEEISSSHCRDPSATSSFQSRADPARLVFRQLTAADIHPVAINILNQKRDGQLLIPSPTGSQPLLRGNGTFGQEYLQQQVVPTELSAFSGFGSLQHRISDSNHTRLTLTHAQQDVEEALPTSTAFAPHPACRTSTTPTSGGH